MSEKKTKNMLIRAIPLDVWERIDMLCRRRGIKRREFLEQALGLFEGGGDKEGYEQAAERAREARLQVNQIMDAIKGYKGIINFKKGIEYVRRNIRMMDDPDTEMNMLLELKSLEENLDEIIREHVPRHEIPEDPEELRKMGLENYAYGDIPLTYKRRGFDTPAHPTETEFEGFGEDLPENLKELQNKIEEIKKEGHSEKEKPKDKEEDDGKTSVFGRGFEGYDED